jgi:quinoprotein glucose dehydrogenase
VRAEARRVLAEVDPAGAVPVLERVLGRAAVAEQQAALATLASVRAPEADAVLARWLDQLIAREVPPEIHLDLLEAAARRPDEAVKQKLARYRQSLPSDDPLADYRDCLAGGDARAGSRIFFGKAEVSCLRCHQIHSSGGAALGGQAGPDLTEVGARHDRRSLLESVVAPNRQIARGFETLLIATTDGRAVTGILKSEDDEALRLVTAEDRIVVVKKSEIDEQKRGASAMPEDLVKYLTRRELRDLVEFLSGMKGALDLRALYADKKGEVAP